MEEFGFFRDLEEMLPEEFTAVFEIARVLEDPASDLARSLSKTLAIASSTPMREEGRSREWRPSRIHSAGDEYEAALMRSVSDVTRIFPHQHLLPDEVFLRRLSQRSLWINTPRTPVIIPFKSSSEEYAPDNFKQKVYLLLDSSTSMSSHHRFQMAKAVLYVFLKRNLAELGHVYLRTFDTDLGPLQTATDAHGLRKLIRYTMRLGQLGNGTVMEKAILQATEDIRARSSLSGAEILMVTDGACHLDVDRIRGALGDSIRLSTVKIGNAEVFPDDRFLRDAASRSSSAQGREILRLEEEIRRVRFDLGISSSDGEKRSLESKIRNLERRVEEQRTAVIGRIRETYGREIELLSSTFVNIDDLSADKIFTLSRHQIDEIRELLAEVESDFSEGVDADSLREAALLYEHVQMILNTAASSEHAAELEAIAGRLRQLLGDMIENGEVPAGGARGISRADLHDLHMMLQMQSTRGDSLMKLLLALLRRAVGRFRR